MLVIPAIDIRDGKVVRLVQGDYSKETIYAEDPLEVALNWKKLGAKLIHVVDLDGALKGKVINLGYVKKIISSRMAIEFGGGIRDTETARKLLRAGVKRLVIGTKAAKDEKFLTDLVGEFGERIAVGIDAKEGRIKTEGWVKNEGLSAIQLAEKTAKLGVKTIIYTDISRDGTLTGADVSGVKEILKAVEINVILSGGIGSYEDLKEVKKLESDGLTGVIIGRALYDKRIELDKAIKILSC